VPVPVVSTRVTLTLLGAFAAQLVPGGPVNVRGTKVKALLAYLALHAGQPQHRDKLMSLLWGDTTDRQARLSLRQAVFQLRRALGDIAGSAVVMEGDTLSLDPVVVAVDAREFERLARLGILEALPDAAALYRGELLEGLVVDERPWEDWAMTERQRLHELAIEVFARLLRHEMESGKDEAATQRALRLLALDPLQEPVHRALMRLYERRGRRATALRQYQACVDLLRRELGSEPESETRRLYAEILQRHRTVAAAATDPSGGAAPVTRVSASRQGSTWPLVGRDAELARIHAAIPGLDSESGRLLLVTGDAGIGKSRVVEEVAAEAERRGWRVVAAGCHQTEQVLPMRPLVDALRAVDVAGRRDLVDALTPALRAELWRLLPELAEAGHVPPAEVQHPVRMFEAMAELLGSLAASRPLALVIEDLHWADEMTLRFLGFLGRRLGKVPLLLLGTARDDELEDAPTLRLLIDEVEREGFGARVVLRPLTRAHTAALVRVLSERRRTPAGVPGAYDDVWNASRGNPFVIVESVRRLQDSREPATGEALLPERVRELAASRIARLSEPARHVVAVAAVAGEPVSFGFLTEAAGMEERQAASIVEELVRRRILEVVDPGLAFTHERIRRVAYDGLLPARRESLHETVARVLERGNGDRLEEVCDRLAHHYGAARVAERAIHYLVMFARAARTRHALDEALHALDEAEGHVPRLPAPARERTTIDIVLEQAFVLSLAARFRDVAALLGAHQERLEALGDPRVAGRFYFRLALTQFYLGDLDASERAARRALTDARASGDRLASGLAHYILSLRGAVIAPVAGVDHGRLAVDDLKGAGTPFWLGFSHYALGANLFLAGDFDAAVDHLTTAIDLGRSVHDVRLESLALGWLASAEYVRGKTEEARAVVDRAVGLAPDAFARANVMIRRAWILLEHGDPQAARRDLEVALGEVERRAMLVLISRGTPLLAEAQRQAGDRDAALATAKRAIAHSVALGARWDEGWARRVLGRIALGDGQASAAEQAFRAAMETFAAVGAPLELARTQLELAAVLAAGGEAKESARLRQAASASLRALNAPRWLATSCP
jgi:DNA-binding SARP family transcriptional activator